MSSKSIQSLIKKVNNIKEKLSKDVGRISFPKIEGKFTRPDQEVRSYGDPKSDKLKISNLLSYFNDDKIKQILTDKPNVSLSTNKGGVAFANNPENWVKEHEGLHFLVNHIAKRYKVNKLDIYNKMNKDIHSKVTEILKPALAEHRNYNNPRDVAIEMVPALRDLLVNKDFRDKALKSVPKEQHQAVMTYAKQSFRNIRDKAKSTTEADLYKAITFKENGSNGDDIDMTYPFDYDEIIQPSGNYLSKSINDSIYQSAIKERLSKSDEIKPKPINRAEHVANSYAQKNGITLSPVPPQIEVDPDFALNVADAFHAMKHDPKDPKVKEAYGALIKETGDQFKHIMSSGLKISRIEPHIENPYKSSKDVIDDVNKNNHLWYYPTDQGFGSGGDFSDHPLMVPTEHKHGDHVLLANDLFRIVHDYFGHAKNGSSFGAKGEESAYRVHKQMFSPLAQKALASETRGQNSYVNFSRQVGDFNKKNKKDTKYADQKAGILPDWAHKLY